MTSVDNLSMFFFNSKYRSQLDLPTFHSSTNSPHSNQPNPEYLAIARNRQFQSLRHHLTSATSIGTHRNRLPKHKPESFNVSKHAHSSHHWPSHEATGDNASQILQKYVWQDSELGADILVHCIILNRFKTNRTDRERVGVSMNLMHILNMLVLKNLLDAESIRKRDPIWDEVVLCSFLDYLHYCSTDEGMNFDFID
ncbi:hypothetical protein HYFRA_00005762 [Hymenoscyphus fraxineus]|uniref:Uncharacterized protein n=1 Tax=Hymenoscyphus fraxineus TaxID=746836 RepID=A0A9N9KQ14_9HELO|nr:hypothetical protein HYFRA_00005762 [Hymenoscyphus fraxineus]